MSMIETPGTQVQFFPPGATEPVPATIRFATGDRNDPNADATSTVVFAALLVDEVPPNLWRHSIRHNDQWLVRGIPRAADHVAYAKLDPDAQYRGFWRPV